MICEECGKDFRHFKSLGLHIVQSHKELGVGQGVAVEAYFRKHMMLPDEDKCKDCGKPLNFYGLSYRFKGCYSCSQSNKGSVSNKDGKITESLMGHTRGVGRKLSAEHIKVWQASKGHYESKKAGIVYHRSNWELAAFKSLDMDERVKTYKVEPFQITYKEEDRDRTYKPDLLIEYIDDSKELVEIKPQFELLKLNVQLKLLATTKWSLENNIPFSVWTEETWPYENGPP